MLILTEKPSVASAFAAALGVPRKDSWWENSEHCIVNALGHLLENYSPEEYDPALKKWSLDTLPIIPEAVKYKPVEKTKAQLAVVKKCFDKHKNDVLLLATDAEREGELIGAEILHYVGFKDFAGARRFWVSEALTPEVIHAGIKNAKPLAEYASYRDQGYARQQADWLVGMNLTRLITQKCNKLLTVGRVQTTLLCAVYERENAIKNFVRDKYYEINVGLDMGEGAKPVIAKLVNPGNGEFPFRFPEGSPLLKEISEKIEKGLLKTGAITAVDTEKKTVHPPQLFNLTALQKEAHKKYGYSPEQTLNIAQALYEKHKCLSYPRTPSRVMGDENVNLIKGIYYKLTAKLKGIDGSNNYLKVHFDESWEVAMAGADPLLIDSSNKRLFNSADLQDHHALIPLTPYPAALSDEEIRIYYLVFERFFTVLKPPYIYNSVTIAGSVSNYAFQGTGIQIIQKGWKDHGEDRETVDILIGNSDDDEDGKKDYEYADLPEAGEYPVTYIAPQEKYTEPKKHYTFASILALMENPRGGDGKHLAGLGTPATRGAIIQKLIDRKYISQKGKNILITEDGEFLISNIMKNEALAAFISIPETTKWEEQLHKDTGAFLDGIKGFVREAVANTSVDTYVHEKKSLGKCRLCGGDVYEGPKSYSCCNYKAEKPCKFTIWKEICGATVSPADAQLLLAGKQTKVKKCVSKAGKEFLAHFKLGQDHKVVFEFPKDKK